MKPLWKTMGYLAALAWALAAPSLWAADQPSSAQNENSIYPAENAERMARPGENESREDQIQTGQPPEAAPVEEEETDSESVQSSAAIPLAPGPGYIWVEAYMLPGGKTVPGFWRPKVMAGFIWAAGSLNQAGFYEPGYWKPLSIVKKGHVWVPGYWHFGRWFPGLWRPALRPGFVWINGRWDHEGLWAGGHWHPTRRAPDGKVWASGYYSLGGIWMPGYWRSSIRAGAFWRHGYYNRHGIWRAGHWRSAKIRKLMPVPRRPHPRRPRH